MRNWWKILFVLGLAGPTACSRESADVVKLQRPAHDPSSATARVSGTVTFDGERPVAAPVKAGGSLYCVRHARDLAMEDALVSENGLVQNVIIYVRSGHERWAYAPPSDFAVLDQKDCVYTPHVLTVMANQQVRIRNSDDTFHNVHAQPKRNTPFNLAQAVRNAEDVQVFSKADEPFRVGCDLHRWMSAYIGVFEHPFHTITDEKGAYSMQLPPGKYELAAWHEKYGLRTAMVDVQDGQKIELNFTFNERSSK